MVLYMKACFFHIYYFVRLYFDEFKFKAVSRSICGFDVYGDIFTYTHVLNRHYFPCMNFGNGASMNDNIPGVDIRNLPESLLDSVELHAKYKAIDEKTEYRLSCKSPWIGANQLPKDFGYPEHEERDILYTSYLRSEALHLRVQ